MFPKMQGYIQTIQYCTVHIFWTTFGNKDFRNHLFYFSWITEQVTLPILHTQCSDIKRVNSIVIHYSGTQIESCYISKINHKAFNSSKRNLKCVLELPVVKSLSEKDIAKIRAYSVIFYHRNTS